MKKSDLMFRASRTMSLHRIVLTILLIVAGINLVRSQEMESPISTQLPLFMKILSFDRNLNSHVKGEIVLGVVYQKGFKTSLKAKEELFSVMNESAPRRVDGIPVRCIPIDLDGDSSLVDVISANKVNILYITPLRGIKMESVSEIARTGQLPTMTGVPAYVESGIAVGIGVKGEKPVIIINLSTAKAEGIDFDSQLLRLARVIR